MMEAVEERYCAKCRKRCGLSQFAEMASVMASKVRSMATQAQKRHKRRDDFHPMVRASATRVRRKKVRAKKRQLPRRLVRKAASCVPWSNGCSASNPAYSITPTSSAAHARRLTANRSIRPSCNKRRRVRSSDRKHRRRTRSNRTV